MLWNKHDIINQLDFNFKQDLKEKTNKNVNMGCALDNGVLPMALTSFWLTGSANEKICKYDKAVKGLATETARTWCFQLINKNRVEMRKKQHNTDKNNQRTGTSLVVQGLRIHGPI